MASGSEPLDQNYRPIPSVLSPNNGLVVQQAGPTVYTDPATGLQYAPGLAALSPLINTGLPTNTPAIVQKQKNTSTGSVASLAKAFGSNNTAGNSIVVVCGCGNGTAMTVADSAGNTYTQAVTAPNSTTFEAAIFYAVNIVGGANTVTVTNAGSAASMAMEIYEVSGLIQQVTAQPAQSSSGTGTGTAASTSAIASSSPNSLAFLGVAVGTAAQAVSVTSGTNWTLDSTQNSGGTAAGLFTFGALSQFLGGAGPVVPQATIASSEPWAAASAVFRPVAIGIQGTVHLGGYNYTRVTTAATTLVKTGAGVLHAVVVNKPTSTATIELDDALTNTTPVIGILGAFAASIAPFTVVYDATFNTGLSVTVGTATVDATIVWR